MIKFIDLLRESLLENKEYKIELKSGKSITKYLNDTEYNNLVANMNSPKGTVKSIELTDKKVESEPEEKPEKNNDTSSRHGNKEDLINKIRLGRDIPIISRDYDVMDIIFNEEIKSKNLRSRFTDYIKGQLGIDIDPENIPDYLRKRSPNNFILHSEDHLFINVSRRYQNDKDKVYDVGQDILDTIKNKKDKLSSSDSDIKVYLKYWESKFNRYKDYPLYDDFDRMLKTKINPFK